MRTVTRWLDRLGLNRVRDITPDGSNLRKKPGKITARFPGHMVHLDVKKIGKIPDGGGSWRVHGLGSEQAKASKRGTGGKVGFTYQHSAIDGNTRLVYTESHEDETAATTIGFFHRARVFFAAHGIDRIVRVITGNGTNYRAKDFERTLRGLVSRHQRIRAYTPRHNGTVERFNRILADECLYASEAERREQIPIFTHHYNYCEDRGGWSGTGWQGKRRAAPCRGRGSYNYSPLAGCVAMDLSGSGTGWPA